MDKDKTLFIDLETTGINFGKDRIIQIGAILPGGKEYKTFVNPGMPIPKDSIEIHHITDDMVADAPSFKDVAEDMIDILNKTKYFVAYNFLFDFQMLQAELNRHIDYVLDESEFTFIDPYKIHRKMYPSTLSNVYKFYTNEEFTGAHDAMEDVIATKRILEEQEKAYSELFEKGPEEVAEHTIGKMGVLGKWFVPDSEGRIIFKQGKFKGEIVDRDHEGYLKWINGLDDTTISEARYISKKLGALSY